MQFSEKKKKIKLKELIKWQHETKQKKKKTLMQCYFKLFYGKQWLFRWKLTSFNLTDWLSENRQKKNSSWFDNAIELVYAQSFYLCLRKSIIFNCWCVCKSLWCTVSKVKINLNSNNSIISHKQCGVLWTVFICTLFQFK